MKAKSCLVVGVSWSVLCGWVHGQSTNASSVALEEIVVTAQKRVENMQQVPNAISVFTGENLRNSGITTTDQLGMVTPGLTFNSVNGFAQPFIRGVGSDQVTSSAEAAAGYYVDGVYFASVSAMLQQLNDIERIEVLKGPQGTLYGRNTTAGAINVITRDPSSDFEGNLSASVGNLDSHQVRGYLSGSSPSGVWGASLAAITTKRGGIMENLVTGDDMNDEDSWGARGKLKFTPNDVLSMTLVLDYSHRDDTGGSAYIALDANPTASAFGGRVSHDPRKTYMDFFDSRYELTDKGASLNTRISTEAVDFVSITAYRKTDRFSGVDLDASDLPIQGVSAPQPGSNWSQEFQLLSKTESRLQWILGAYTFQSEVGFEPLDIYVPGGVPSFIEVNGVQETQAYALFGQGTYSFSDEWKLTAGIRRNWEEKELVDAFTRIAEFGLTIPDADQSQRWNNTSPMITLEYHQDDLLLYAKASKGFKSGTYNVLAAADPVVDPEEMKAYEVGGKHDLRSNSLRINWSGFYYDYTNLQVSIVQNGQPKLLNAAGAEIYGADIDIQTIITESFQVAVGAAWLDASYSDFEGAVVFLPDTATGFGNVATTTDASGNDAIRAPELTLSLQLQYSVPMHDIGSVDLIANYYHNSGFSFDPANLYKQKKYDLVNLRLNLRILQDQLMLSAFGRNLLDEEILTGVAPTNMVILGQYDLPRTYGVEVSYSF